MKHYGSITDIDGAKLDPVDIICGGSPCQDLSVAGKRAGLDGGTRSHLFYEMVRIIKEMRKATDGKKPRYIVWENVPGAFSSNNGYDFMSVLQSFAEIAEADVHVPEPERKANKLVWRYAGEMVGSGWSIAWRTVDAQYWGVPQRRRRIYLVVDLDSERAGEILFERKSLSGNTEPGRETRKGTASDAYASAHTDCYPSIARCLTAEHDASPCIDRGQNICVYDARGNGSGDIVPTLTGDHENSITDYTAICVGNGQLNQISMTDKTHCLDCMHDQQIILKREHASHGYIVRRLTPLECSRLQGFPDCWELDLETPELTEEDIAFWTEVFETHRKIVSPDVKPRTRNQIIKWLKDPCSDSASYKMWGNGMALPNMLFVISRIKEMHDNA